MNHEKDEATVALGALSESLRPLGAPLRVEQSLVKEFRRLNRPWPRGAWRRALAPSALLAAIILAILVWTPDPKLPTAPSRSVAEVATDYFPVGFPQPLDPGEFALVIRVTMSRPDVARLGLPLLAETAAPVVQADVVLGEDGVARAIRFVH